MQHVNAEPFTFVDTRFQVEYETFPGWDDGGNYSENRRVEVTLSRLSSPPPPHSSGPPLCRSKIDAEVRKKPSVSSRSVVTTQNLRGGVLRTRCPADKTHILKSYLFF